MWYIQTMKYHSVMRMKKLKIHATSWINSTNMILSKISHKNVNRIFLLHKVQERQSWWCWKSGPWLGYPMLGGRDWEGTWGEFWDSYNILFVGFCLYECVYFVKIHLSVYTYNLCTFLMYCVSGTAKGLRCTLPASLLQGFGRRQETWYSWVRDREVDYSQRGKQQELYAPSGVPPSPCSESSRGRPEWVCVRWGTPSLEDPNLS